MSSSRRAGLAGLAAAALVVAGCGSSAASGSATSAARAARRALVAPALADGRRQVPAEPDRQPARMGTMNVTAVITWFIAVAGGLFLLAARLTGFTSGFQGAAAARLPVPVIYAAAAGSATARSGVGAMT